MSDLSINGREHGLTHIGPFLRKWEERFGRAVLVEAMAVQLGIDVSAPDPELKYQETWLNEMVVFPRTARPASDWIHFHGDRRRFFERLIRQASEKLDKGPSEGA